MPTVSARDRPGIGEWRDVSLDDYQDAIEIIGMWRATLGEAVLKRVLRIRDRNEPLLIRAGMIADGDRL